MSVKATVPIEFNFGDDVQANIEVALAQALNFKSGEVTKQIIKMALEKDGRTSMLQNAIQSAIRTEAKLQIAAVLVERQEEIRQAVRAKVAELLTPEVVADNVINALQQTTAEINLASQESLTFSRPGVKASRAFGDDEDEEV